MDYVQLTDDHQQHMLDTIGVQSVDQLFANLADEYRLGRPLNLPPALSELEITRELQRLAANSQSANELTCFLGAGAYDHFIPTLIDQIGTGRGEFLTAYTPYQAEASQGSLQIFFEFQTQVSRLTGLDIANASLYEGATAVSEAVYMAINVSGRRKILVASTLHPHYLSVIRSSVHDLPVDLVELPATNGRIDPQTVSDELIKDTACVVIQSPNVYGLVESSSEIFELAHGNPKTLAISVFNPTACALLKNPGACGADIAVGEGQPLGIGLQYGGPYLGLFAAREKLIRKMPGRLIGQTVDADGRRGFCLTLQTREQHIRGAKATSNVCTNQGLLAVRASIYLTAMGGNGLREVARQCYHKAHYAADKISQLDGFDLAYPDSTFFHEFVVNCPKDADHIAAAARDQGVLAGLPLTRLNIGESNQLLIAVTEKRTVDEIDRLVEVLRNA